MLLSYVAFYDFTMSEITEIIVTSFPIFEHFSKYIDLTLYLQVFKFT